MACLPFRKRNQLLGMTVVVRADRDDIDIGVFRNRPGIGVPTCDPITVADFFEAGRIDVANRRDFNALDRLVRADMRLADTKADDAHTECFQGRTMPKIKKLPHSG